MLRTVEAEKYVAVLDVRYGSRYGELNERFYRRIDLVFGFVGLFGGSAVVFGAVSANPTLAAWSGGVVAACAVFERLIRPIERAVEHRDFKKKFADLDARSSAMSCVELDTALRRLQMEAPTGISSLAIPAFNANLRSNGRDESVIPETAWQKAVALLA